MVPPRVGEGQDIGLHLLVLRFQSGDEGAFARLFDRFGDRTLRYLRGLVGDDAEDVQQEVWLSVYNNAKELANPSVFRTWLFRVARHRAIDFLRSATRERVVFEDTDARALAVSDEQDGPLPDAAFVTDALLAIPPPQREALTLKYYDDLSYQEIALVVGAPIGTVRTRIHHGKKRLLELLNQKEAQT